MSEEISWADLLAEVVERLALKHESITYEFEDLEFERIPVEGARSALPAGRIKLNGKLTITSTKSD